MLLEAPTHLGNLGAVVRVAAAAGAAAVLTTGRHDPWHPAALRGSAGLHFALPVARVEAAAAGSGRPLLAIDPDGEPLRPGAIPDGALLAFGSERRGLSDTLLAAAERRIAIPMRPGRLQPEPGERGRGRPVRLASWPDLSAGRRLSWLRIDHHRFGRVAPVDQDALVLDPGPAGGDQIERQRIAAVLEPQHAGGQRLRRVVAAAPARRPAR